VSTSSEAVSGNTSEPQHHLSYRDKALLLTTAAGILWVLAVGAVVGDVGEHDRMPDSISTGLCVLAGTASIIAVAFWTRSASAATIGALAAEVEQVSAKVTQPSVGGTVALPALAARLQHAGRAGGRRLEQSEYYQVYTDVLMDLCGLQPEQEDPPATAADSEQ
jgi:hypothetical protein